MSIEEKTPTCISENNLERLAAAGIFVAARFGADHAYKNGVRLYKPTVEEIAENDRRKEAGEIGIVVSRHTLVVYTYENQWIVEGVDFCPGPGPGDFVAYFRKEGEAVQDIMNYYSGYDARYWYKEIIRKASEERSARYEESMAAGVEFEEKDSEKWGVGAMHLIPEYWFGVDKKKPRA